MRAHVLASGVVRVERPVYTYRVLFEDGRVVDVEVDVDDSDVRALILTTTKAERIVGMTRLACVGWSTVAS